MLEPMVANFHLPLPDSTVRRLSCLAARPSCTRPTPSFCTCCFPWESGWAAVVLSVLMCRELPVDRCFGPAPRPAYLCLLICRRTPALGNEFAARHNNTVAANFDCSQLQSRSSEWRCPLHPFGSADPQHHLWTPNRFARFRSRAWNRFPRRLPVPNSACQNAGFMEKSNSPIGWPGGARTTDLTSTPGTTP